MYTEAAYVFGVVLLALGTALMTKADFGLSMVVAPAYIVHVKLSALWPFFSFGMASYVVEGLLLVVLMLVVRRFKVAYLFSFVTALIYGVLLDGFLLPVGLLPGVFPVRICCFILGLPTVSAGVAMIFNTYLPAEAYDLFVKEVAAVFHLPLPRVKTAYDCTSCVVAVVLSFLFFGLWQFVGVNWGTVLCALVNGWLIGRFSAWYQRMFTFADRFPLRQYCE